MTNVVTMTGTPLVQPDDLLRLLLDRDDIKSLVIVVGRDDDKAEVMWTRQPIIELTMASNQLRVEVDKMVALTVEDI